MGWRMPRLKKPPDRYREMKLLIQGSLAVSGMTQADAANRMDMTPKTFRSRLREPDRLTLGELNRLAVILDIPTENLKAALPMR